MVDEEKAATYLEPGKLISEGLDQADADRYRNKLEGLGLAVTLHGPSDFSTDAANAGNYISTPASVTPIDNSSMQSTASVEPSIDTQTVAFSCPKCLLVQEKSEQCTGCGIYFEKYAQRANRSEALEDTTPAPARSARSSDSEISIPALAAAAVAAIIFALIWKFVALQFDRELGLIAWAAGGAIGGAAMVFGARGMLNASICACLVVASIFPGKYLFVSSYIDESLAYMELESDQSLVDVFYSEIASERDAYAAISRDDESIKQFMIDYEYTDASHPAAVSAGEFEYFMDEMEPWLDMPADADADGAVYAPEEFKDAMAGAVSPWTLVLESLGLIDMLFLLFGVSTAFRMVQAGKPG